MKFHLIALFSLLLCYTAWSQNTSQSVSSRHSIGNWENDSRFPDDTFRFARLKPENHSEWGVDYPDSDLNFSFRLQQMTSLKVDPKPVVTSILDAKLKECPFLYMVETVSLQLQPREIPILRDHLLNGGFLMIDDFWGPKAWKNTQEQLKKVFPDREIKELELDHPIFNIVFPIKEKPQVPGIGLGIEKMKAGITWHQKGKIPHFYGIFDDQDRMMVVICRNTDLGDGWEREGENYYFFKEFSEKKAYPMGINIIVYMMTN